VRLKLEIEPRPSSTWGITLANRLPYTEWKEISDEVKLKADYTCEICGSVNGVMHCHEVWKFDDRSKIQHLAGCLCLCVRCHDVKHFGRSTQVYKHDYQEKLIEHWCRVNRASRDEFKLHLASIRSINIKRADKHYIVKVGRRILT
jgi:hypothetical protein